MVPATEDSRYNTMENMVKCLRAAHHQGDAVLLPVWSYNVISMVFKPLYGEKDSFWESGEDGKDSEPEERDAQEETRV